MAHQSSSPHQGLSNDTALETIGGGQFSAQGLSPPYGADPSSSFSQQHGDRRERHAHKLVHLLFSSHPCFSQLWGGESDINVNVPGHTQAPSHTHSHTHTHDLARPTLHLTARSCSRPFTRTLAWTASMILQASKTAAQLLLAHRPPGPQA